MRIILNQPLLGLIVVIAMLSQACTGAGQSSLPASQLVAKSALDKEVQQAAEAFLKRAYYECGDSYFMRQQAIKWPRNSPYPVDPRPVYTQIKGLEWKVEGQEIIASPLTEAERLNGVTRPLLEWKGEIVVTGRVFRKYDHQSVGAATSESDRQRQLNIPGEWGAWNDIGVGPLTRFPLTKENGKWAVGDANSRTGAFSPETINPVDCAAIPQASLKVSQVPDPTPPPIKNPVSPVPATMVADPKLVPPNALPKKSP